MAEQLTMFDRMGLGWPPVKVAAEWIREGWISRLENLADYADDPEWPEREEPFDEYVLDEFRTHSGWYGLEDFHGFCGIQFSPRGAVLTRRDRSGETVSKAEILRYLGVQPSGQ